MIAFLLIDLGLNSILDYDLFNNQTSINGTPSLLLGLLGLQTVVEISTFLILFIAMADTFLFRVGLLGLLIKKFQTVLLFHPLYIAITIASGSLRVQHLSVEGNSLSSLYRYDTYVRMSMVQKICKLIPLPDFMMQLTFHSEMFILCGLYTVTCSTSQRLLNWLISFVVAIPYYLLNLRATTKLGNPVYFNKDAWVALIKQVLSFMIADERDF